MYKSNPSAVSITSSPVVPCADTDDYLQAEGHIAGCTTDALQAAFAALNFRVAKLGRMTSLVCRRSDALFVVSVGGDFNASRVQSEAALHAILDELRATLTSSGYGSK